MRQAADLASTRTLPPDRNFPTFHSLVTRRGHETQHPHSKGAAELSTGREWERGWSNVKGRPPSEQQAEPRTKKPKAGMPRSTTAPNMMPAEQNANQISSQ